LLSKHWDKKNQHACLLLMQSCFATSAICSGSKRICVKRVLKCLFSLLNGANPKTIFKYVLLFNIRYNGR
jgi:hypothetical protein